MLGKDVTALRARSRNPYRYPRGRFEDLKPDVVRQRVYGGKTGPFDLLRRKDILLRSDLELELTNLLFESGALLCELLVLRTPQVARESGRIHSVVDSRC